MRNYEVTFIVDPTLPGDEIKSAAKKYIDLIKGGAKITNIDELGIRQLAYPIKRKNTGIYYCVEFEAENGVMIAPLELAMRRDEQLLRFLTVSLDKHGVKYNADKRAGKIGKIIKKKKVEEEPQHKRRNNNKNRKKRPSNNNNNSNNNNQGQNKDKDKTAAPAATTPAPAAEAKPKS